LESIHLTFRPSVKMRRHVTYVRNLMLRTSLIVSHISY